MHDFSGVSLFGATGFGDFLVGLTVLFNAGFDGFVFGHVCSLDKDTSKSSPEDCEDSGTEDAERSNTVLEVFILWSFSNGVVEVTLPVTEPSSWSDWFE